jgi:hypothetical protein
MQVVTATCLTNVVDRFVEDKGTAKAIHNFDEVLRVTITVKEFENRMPVDTACTR